MDIEDFKRVIFQTFSFYDPDTQLITMSDKDEVMVLAKQSDGSCSLFSISETDMNHAQKKDDLDCKHVIDYSAPRLVKFVFTLKDAGEICLKNI